MKQDAGKSLLKEAQQAFALCQEVERENRERAKDDIRFARLGEQWDPDLKKTRARDGRPCLTINKLPPFIRQVVNDARQNKPQIRVLAQDSNADPETADIFSGLIRNIELSSRADAAYDTAIDNAATCGMGFFRVNLDYVDEETWDQDVIIERIMDPFSVYGDPHSTAADGSDWNQCFVTEMMPKAEFERRFGGADPIDWDAVEFPDDWIDGDRIMVAEYWVREKTTKTIYLMTNGEVVDEDALKEGMEAFAAQQIYPTGATREVPCYKVTQHIMTGAEVLESNEWAGKYIPIIPVYGEEVVYDGKRHFRSLIRDAKDAQIMYNAWRTASTELVALAPKAPFIGPEGAFDVDPDKWETANTQSHAYLEYDAKAGPAPQRQPFAGVPAGALQEALNASDDMKAVVGIYDAGIGARSNETSGKAIMARQRESDTSTFHFIDNLSRAIEHCGRILIDLIPKVYGPERIIRVLGEDYREAQAVQLGTPEEAMQSRQEAMQAQAEGQQQAQAMTRIYSFEAGKYDLAVDVGPSFTTRREEAATQMMELLRAFPAAAPVIGDLLAKNLDWPGADEIADRLKAMLAQQQGGGEQQGADPEVQIEAMKAQADAQMDAEKLRLDWYKAETDRMKVAADAAQPRETPQL